MHPAEAETGADSPSSDRAHGLDYERVFGRARLVVSASAHVEVVREASAAGERRRYSKRFLVAPDGDFRRWTLRESQVLAYLAAQGVRCIPAIAGHATGPNDALRTFDAGIAVRDWSSLLRLERDGRPVSDVFADAAHWWALARHAVRALEALHVAGVVHLRIAPGNVCVPLMRDGPGDAAGTTVGVHFARLALIDLALATCPGVAFPRPLPDELTASDRGQSPRLAAALDAARNGDSSLLQALDWRCDLFAAAEVLRGCLPGEEGASHGGWTDARYERAVQLLDVMRDAHDRGDAQRRPHEEIVARCEEELHDGLVASLMGGFAFSRAAPSAPQPVVTPVDTSEVAYRDAAPAPQARRDAKPVPLGLAIAAGLVLVLAGVGLHVVERWHAERAEPQVELPATRTAQVAPPAADAREASQPSTSGSGLPGDVQTVQRAARAEPAPSQGTTGAAQPMAPVEVSPVEPPRTDAAPATTPAPAAQPEPPGNAPADGPPSTAVAATASPTLTAYATRMQGDVAQVLAAAARGSRPADDDRILQAARSMRAIVPPSGLPTQSRTTARTLNAQARAAWERQDLARAVELQQRAFRANPNDPEVTGNLAFFYLKVDPPRPAQARELALYALGVRGGSFPAGREQDWGTLAIASALEGREADAMQALYVMFALTKDPERACRAAVLAMEQYGPALTRPAEAMLARAGRRGTASSAPSCLRVYPR